MSAVQSGRSATTKPRTALASAIAVGTVVALAVATLFILTLTAKHTSNPSRAAAHTDQAYAPLIQYRGTGQPPTAAATNHAPGAPPTTGLRAAEHSYGAVP